LTFTAETVNVCPLDKWRAAEMEDVDKLWELYKTALAAIESRRGGNPEMVARLALESARIWLAAWEREQP